MNTVIIESPSTQNIKYARECIEYCLDKNEAPFVAHLIHSVGHDEEQNKNSLYRKSESAGLEWTIKSDYVVSYVDYSITKNMFVGIDKAKQCNKSVLYRRIYPFPNQFFILVSGKRCCGKDTISNIIKSLFSKRVTIKGFSHILKEKFCSEFGLDYEQLLNNYEYKMKYRDELKSYADRRFESDGDMAFVQDIIEHVGVKPGIFVIPDHRFEHESTYFDEMKKENSNVLFLNVVTNDEEKKARGWKYDKTHDESSYETGLDTYRGFDIIISNNGSYDELYAKVQKVMNMYQIR